MKTEPAFTSSTDAVSAQLEGEAVLLHLGTKRYFRLNETAAEVWAALERGVVHPSTLTALLCEHFDVQPAEAGAEVDRLLRELEARGLVLSGEVAP